MGDTVRLAFKNPNYVDVFRWEANRSYRTSVKADWYKGLDTEQQRLLQCVYRWDIVVEHRDRARSQVFLEIEVAKPKQATLAQLLFY